MERLTADYRPESRLSRPLRLATQMLRRREGMSQEAAAQAFENLPVTIEVRVGGCRLAVEDLLKLETGSVITLDRAAGEMVDVLVGDVLVASAEVVVNEHRMSVRISEFQPEKVA